jgi:hypothetical protein
MAPGRKGLAPALSLALRTKVLQEAFADLGRRRQDQA